MMKEIGCGVLVNEILLANIQKMETDVEKLRSFHKYLDRFPNIIRIFIQF